MAKLLSCCQTCLAMLQHFELREKYSLNKREFFCKASYSADVQCKIILFLPNLISTLAAFS